MGLISDLDRAAFAGYCVTWARWVEAEEALKTYGSVLKGPKGFPIRSPYLAVATQALDQMKALLAEFGMTPSTRTKVSAIAPIKERDEFEEIFGSGR